MKLERRAAAGLLAAALATLAAPLAGQQVTLTLVNEGTVKHNLTIKDTGLNVSQDVGVGKTETVTFTAPAKPGQHRIVCDQPGHEQAGMVGTLVVEQ